MDGGGDSQDGNVINVTEVHTFKFLMLNLMWCIFCQNKIWRTFRITCTFLELHIVSEIFALRVVPCGSAESLGITHRSYPISDVQGDKIMEIVLPSLLSFTPGSVVSTAQRGGGCTSVRPFSLSPSPFSPLIWCVRKRLRGTEKRQRIKLCCATCLHCLWGTCSRFGIKFLPSLVKFFLTY